MFEKERSRRKALETKEAEPRSGLPEQMRRRAILAAALLASAAGLIKGVESNEPQSQSHTEVTTQHQPVKAVNEQKIREMQSKTRTALAILGKAVELSAENKLIPPEAETKTFDITAVDISLDDVKNYRSATDLEEMLHRIEGIGDENVDEAKAMYQQLLEDVNINVEGDGITASLETPNGGFEITTMTETIWNEAENTPKGQKIVSYSNSKVDGGDLWIYVRDDLSEDENQKRLRKHIAEEVERSALAIMKAHYQPST